jgi:putative ABC transport system permease protein
MSSWLVAVRIARREARRAKGRSALVVTLIGLPALAAAFVAVTAAMFTLSPEERVVRDLGTADASLTWFGSPIRQQDTVGWSTTGPPPAPSFDASEPTTEEVRALVPAVDRIAERWDGPVRMVTGAGAGMLEGIAFDLTDPLFHGLAEVAEGAAPSAPDQVALTVPAASRLDAGVGDRVEVAVTGERYTVVGIVEFPDELRLERVVFHPDGLPGDDWARQWLVATTEPVTWGRVRQLNQHGFVVYSRAVALDPPPEVREFEAGGGVGAEVFGTAVLVGGLGVLEVVLLAGPTFAIGVRRRQRQLGLVAVAGGTPAHLRRIVLADGLVLGVLGAVTGIALGVATALLGRPLVEQYLTGMRAGGWRVFPLALVGIAVVAIGTGLLAAMVPAFTAARQQVVAALAGRRGVVRSRRRWLVLGLVMVGAGGVIAGLGAWSVSAAVVLAGLVVGQLGLVLCTPTLVGLVARLGSRLPLAPRIALRDTARNRSAAAPAISAVMAAVAGAAAAGMMLIALGPASAESWQPYRPGTVVANGPWQSTEDGPGGSGGQASADGTTADAERVARATLPVDQVRQVSQPSCNVDRGLPCQLTVVMPEEHRCPYWDAAQPLSAADQRAANRDTRCDRLEEPIQFVEVVDDGAALDVLTGADPGQLPRAAAVLRDGGAVVTDQRYLRDGMVTLELISYQETDGKPFPIDQQTTTVPGHLLPVADATLPPILSPGAVRALGLEVVPGPLLASTTRTPTRDEEDAFAAGMEAMGGWGYVERSTSEADEFTPLLVVLAAAAGLVALGAAAIATGLAAADRRPDLATLGAVGASPRVRRSLSLSQSGVIAGIGTCLGLLAGLGAAFAVLAALNQRYATVWPAPEPYPIAVPWPVVGVLLVVPVVAMLGAGLLTRSRLPIERRPT